MKYAAQNEILGKAWELFYLKEQNFCLGTQTDTWKD